MSNRQRYEISICFTDKGGTRRYQNNIGSLWFDGEKGNIELPPGVALVGGQPDTFINVGVPYNQRQGGQQQRGQQQRGQGRGNQDRGWGESGANSSDDDVPF